MSELRRKDTPAQGGGVDKRKLFQNNPGLISFSVDEAEEEEEKVEKEKEEVKKKNSGNILVVETDFERMPRRSSFRSKERRELTRGASIQFDEKPANVIVNSTSTTDATGAESDCKEEEEEPEKESGNSEELNEMARLSL